MTWKRRAVVIAALVLANLASGPRAASAPESPETLSTTSAAFARTRAALPDRYLIYETRRFVVLSDAAPAWTLDQAERLERTHHQYQRFARRLGLRPAPLTNKLVCVLFDDRDDYAAFALGQDGVSDPWISGYYTPAADRIVFYHGDANPSVVEAREKLARMSSDVDRLEDQAQDARRRGRREQAETLRGRGASFREHLEREIGRVDDFARQVTTATLVHEAIHQLMFHTEVLSPTIGYPIWMSEGIATAFETEVTTGAFGPDHEYEPRRTTFDRLLHGDRLIPLHRLVAMSEPPADESLVQPVYHQSYALVTWMSRFRRDELRTFIDLANREPDGAIRPRRALALFERAFGDVDAVERAWLRYERAR